MKNLVKLLALLIALTLCLTACGGKEGGENGGAGENEASENGNSENTENENGTANNGENTEPAEKNYFEQYYPTAWSKSISYMYEALPDNETIRYFAKVKIDNVRDGIYTQADFYKNGVRTNFIFFEITIIEDYYGKANAGTKLNCIIQCHTEDENGEISGGYNPAITTDGVRELLQKHEYFIFYFQPINEWYDMPLCKDGETVIEVGTLSEPLGGIRPVDYEILPLTDGKIDLDSINDFYKSEGLHENMTTNQNITGFDETFGHGTTLEEAAEKIRELYDFHVNVKDTIVFPSSPNGDID